MIILLSLVRSNSKGEIGFLKTSNRICVALSRAKYGLYIIGNANLLARNDLWNQVINTFKKTSTSPSSTTSYSSFGTSMALQCQNHPEKTTMVSRAEDFNRVEDGGCNIKCNQQLDCGHICPRFCHPYPHDQLECHKPCNRLHEGNYIFNPYFILSRLICNICSID